MAKFVYGCQLWVGKQWLRVEPREGEVGDGDGEEPQQVLMS